MHLLILMYCIEDVTPGWQYLIYAPGHDPAGTRRLLQRGFDTEWSIAIALADSEAGIFCGRRRHPLSKPFTIMLMDTLLALEDNIANFSAALFRQETEAVHQMWRTQDDMLAAMQVMHNGQAIEDLPDYGG